MSETKTLCKWHKEDFKEKRKKLIKIVGEPHFFCEKCGRAAKKEKWLCKPESLEN